MFPYWFLFCEFLNICLNLKAKAQEPTASGKRSAYFIREAIKMISSGGVGRAVSEAVKGQQGGSWVLIEMLCMCLRVSILVVMLCCHKMFLFHKILLVAVEADGQECRNLFNSNWKIIHSRIYVVWWLRPTFLMQGTRVWSLVKRAGPMCHNQDLAQP